MLLDTALAREAVGLALPMIEPAVASRRLGASGFAHLVILDPAKPYGRYDLMEAVLYEHAVGDRTRWDADYAAFALAKAELSWRTGRGGSAVHREAPYLLRPGDTLLDGGICDDGLVVAVSGCESWFDEALAHVVAQLCRALARERRALLAASGAVELSPDGVSGRP